MSSFIVQVLPILIVGGNNNQKLAMKVDLTCWGLVLVCLDAAQVGINRRASRRWIKIRNVWCTYFAG